MTNQTNEETSPTFLSHLVELRDRLIKIMLAVGILFICLMPFAQDLYTWLSEPLRSALPEGQRMIAIGVITPFLTPYKLALLTAFFIAVPFVFYQVWLFVAPGLYSHEKKLTIPLVTSSVILFYVGIAFAYYILLPMMFSVLQVFTPEGVDATPDIAAYLDFVMMIFIAFGFCFEMPIATVLIISTGMTTAEKLAQNRPYVIVGAFVLGMFLTPPDVISQIMLAIPMWLLFEVGLIASKLFSKRVTEAGQEKEAREEAERKMIDDEAKAAALGATGLAAASAANAAFADDHDQAANTSSDDTNNNLSDWEDDNYIYEEDESVNLDSDVYEEEELPLTDEEMTAEIERIEAEFDELEGKDDSLTDHQTNDSDDDTPKKPDKSN